MNDKPEVDSVKDRLAKIKVFKDHLISTGIDPDKATLAARRKVEGIKEKKILYFDMDNVLVDFDSALVQLEKYNPSVLEIYEGRLDEIPGIFSNMKPYGEAVEVYHQMRQIFDVYILSTAPWENPSAWKDKLAWVKKHLGETATKRLILTHHKNLNIGHFLIDDRTKNGAEEFTGEHIHFGSDKFPNWPTVMNYLLSKV